MTGPSIHCLNRSPADLTTPFHPSTCHPEVVRCDSAEKKNRVVVSTLLRNFPKITVKVDNVDTLYDVPKKVKMSAEVENSKDEEVKEQKTKKSLKKKILENWPAGIKVLELLLCAISMGFIYEPISNVTFGRIKMHHIGVMYTAYTGYMVINCVLLVSRALGDKIPYRTVSLFAVIGSALFLITGILLLVDTDYFTRDMTRPIQHDYNSSENTIKTRFKVSAGFAFLNVLLFAADTVLTFKFQEDF